MVRFVHAMTIDPPKSIAVVVHHEDRQYESVSPLNDPQLCHARRRNKRPTEVRLVYPCLLSYVVYPVYFLESFFRDSIDLSGV